MGNIMLRMGIKPTSSASRASVLPKHTYIKMEPVTTVGHHFKILKPRTNKRFRQNFLVEQIGNTWNQLPADVVNAPSLNAFKSRIDKHWLQH